MIPIPLAGLTGMFDAAGFWQNLASFLGAAAVWAQHRAAVKQDPIAELTDRLRRPVRWTMTHPIVSLRRKVGRRRVDLA